MSSKLLSNVDCTSVGVVDSLSTKPLILKPSFNFKIILENKYLKNKKNNTRMLIHRAYVRIGLC